MTSDEAQRDCLTASSVPTQPPTRILSRQERYERLLRLCEAVLWQMALRRMH